MHVVKWLVRDIREHNIIFIKIHVDFNIPIPILHKRCELKEGKGNTVTGITKNKKSY